VAPTWHPSWCDPASCRADAETSAYHFGAPIVVEPAALGDSRVTVRLLAESWAPPRKATTSVELILERTDVTLSIATEFATKQYLRLVAALTDPALLDVVRAEARRGENRNPGLSGPGW
jgi:hypothetical protein